MDTPRVTKAYAPDDPEICDSFDWERSGEIFAVFSLLFTLSITTSNVMSLWFWILASIHIGALGYGAWCHIRRLLPTEITWDTSEITKRDVQRFMRGEPTIPELKSTNTSLARKYLRSFIEETELWEEGTTDSHFKKGEVRIFFGHEKIELSDTIFSDNEIFEGRTIKLTGDSSVSKLYNKCQKIYSSIQKRRNGWID